MARPDNIRIKTSVMNNLARKIGHRHAHIQPTADELSEVYTTMRLRWPSLRRIHAMRACI